MILPAGNAVSAARAFFLWAGAVHNCKLQIDDCRLINRITLAFFASVVI
jgi:hypothetical protein